MNTNHEIFGELLALELPNNHCGSLDRGLRIIRNFGTVVRNNSVQAAIKLQFRDARAFIHKDFCGRRDIRNLKRGF